MEIQVAVKLSESEIIMIRKAIGCYSPLSSGPFQSKEDRDLAARLVNAQERARKLAARHRAPAMIAEPHKGGADG